MAAEVHPLQPYYEYLSYLFRRPPLPAGQEEMEIGYRDYLQARQPITFEISSHDWEIMFRRTCPTCAARQAAFTAADVPCKSLYADWVPAEGDNPLN